MATQDRARHSCLVGVERVENARLIACRRRWIADGRPAHHCAAELIRLATRRACGVCGAIEEKDEKGLDPVAVSTGVSDVQAVIRSLGHTVRVLNEIALLQDSCPLAAEIAVRGLREVKAEVAPDVELVSV